MWLRAAVAAALSLAVCVQGTVHELTAADFDAHTAKGVWLVEFYAPWCGHCKNLQPIWESAAAILDGVVNFAKVDCTASPELGKRFAIRGYPTIKGLLQGPSGPQLDYRGNRQLASIIEFATRLVEPAVQELPDHIILALGIERPEFLFVGDESPESKAAEAVYRSMAEERRLGAKFWASTSTWTRQHLGLAAYPAVLVRKDSFQRVYTGPLARPQLDLWVLRERLVTVPQLGMGEAGTAQLADLMQTNRSVLLAIVGKARPQASQDLRKAVQEVGRQLNGPDTTDELANKYTYAWVDGDEHFKFLSKFFWLRRDDLPQLMLVDFAADRHYAHANSDYKYPTTEVLQFLKDADSGKLKLRGDWWDDQLRLAGLLWINFKDFYHEAPLVVALLVGLPLFFLVLACIMPTQIHPQEEMYRQMVVAEQEEIKEMEKKIKEEEARLKAMSGGWDDGSQWAPKKEVQAPPKAASEKKDD